MLHYTVHGNGDGMNWISHAALQSERRGGQLSHLLVQLHCPASCSITRLTRYKFAHWSWRRTKCLPHFTDTFRRAAYDNVRKLTSVCQPPPTATVASTTPPTPTGQPAGKKVKLDTRTEALKFIGLQPAVLPAVSEFDRYILTFFGAIFVFLICN